MFIVVGYLKEISSNLNTELIYPNNTVDEWKSDGVQY